MSSKLSEQAFPVDPKKVEYEELVPDYPDDGLEYPDPTPVAIPSRHGLISEGDRLRQLIVSELTQLRADAAGIDSPEEADDFDVPDEDDFFPVSVHQMEEDFDHLGIPIGQSEDLTPEEAEPSEPGPQNNNSGSNGGSPPAPPPFEPARPEGETTPAEPANIVTLPDGRKAQLLEP